MDIIERQWEMLVENLMAIGAMHEHISKPQVEYLTFVDDHGNEGIFEFDKDMRTITLLKSSEELKNQLW